MKLLPILAFSLLLLLPAQSESVALNDEFATREILTGPLPLTWSGSAQGLTLEPEFERVGDDGDVNGTMWFEWTAPQTGIFEFRDPRAFPVGLPGAFSIEIFAARPLTEPQIPLPHVIYESDRVVRGKLLQAEAGGRFWIALGHDGTFVPDNQASLRISKVTPAPSTKETAALLSGDDTVVVREATVGEGWWRWRAPSAGVWRFGFGSGGGVEVLRADGSNPLDGSFHFSVPEGEVIFFHAQFDPGLAVLAEFSFQPLPPSQVPVNITPEKALPLVPDDDGAGAVSDLPERTSPSIPVPPVWFSWTATSDGVVSVLPSIAVLDAVSVFRDDNGTLTRLDAGTSGYRNPFVPVSAGQRFLISFLGEGPGTINMRVNYLLFRGSDSFAGSRLLEFFVNPGLGAFAADYLGDATVEPGEPELLSANERTKWWAYNSASEAFVRFTGRRLNVYTGDNFENLTLVTSLNYNGSGFWSTPWIHAAAGTVYQLQVFDGPPGNGLVHVAADVRPKSLQDDFASPARLTPVEFSFDFPLRGIVSTVLTTAEPGEPQPAPGVPATRTAWLLWTAEFTGRAGMAWTPLWTETAVEPLGQPVVAVWTGDSLSSLQRVPSQSAPILAPFPGVASFDVVEGTVYSFQVETPADVVGLTLRLGLIFADPGSWDSFATPLSATELLVSGVGHNYKMPGRATFEPGESTEGLPAPAAGYTSGTYWMRWTAPSAGVWRFTPSVDGLFPPASGEVTVALTFYRDSLASGRLAVLDHSHPGPLYLKVREGESIAIGNVVHLYDTGNVRFRPTLPVAIPAVPGIALAEWYGLPSPANINASYSADGIPLLLKHALGLDPVLNSLPGGNDPNAARWPLLTLSPVGEPTLTFRANAPFQLGNGIDISGEISRDLISWHSAPETTSPEGIRTVTVPMRDANGFLRLKASMR